VLGGLGGRVRAPAKTEYQVSARVLDNDSHVVVPGRGEDTNHGGMRHLALEEQHIAHARLREHRAQAGGHRHTGMQRA
jgi:hypothetical protein